MATFLAVNKEKVMNKKPYSAGAVKHSFWFMEFRKVVSLRAKGKTWDEIKQLNEDENIFGAPTPLRANQIWSTVSGRIKCLDDSFYPVFQSCDVSAQKLFALVAAMAYDTLFAEFVYEVIREKLIIGSNEYADSDIRIFFKNKQEQDDKVAKWTDVTTKRLGACYKTLLFEAGLTDKGKDLRKILKPILDPAMERWLLDQNMEYYVKALTGVR
jgi:hypothetical protein